MKKINNLKYITAIALFINIFTGCAQGIEPPYETEVRVVATDGLGAPLDDAKIELLFAHLFDAKTRTYKGKTDVNGNFIAKDKIVSQLILRANKAGFYGVDRERVLIRAEIDERDVRNYELPVTMRRILNPRPLYARKIDRAVPEDGAWIGFDLKVGDWVGGFGDGIIADLEVKFEKEFVRCKQFTNATEDIERLKKIHNERPDLKQGYFEVVDEFYERKCDYSYEEAVRFRAGKWDASLEIRFGGQYEGVIEVVDDYHAYSGLKMPHKAPENGYRKVWKMEADNYQHLPMEEKGYFMRVREQLDEEGELISANYAKFHQPIRIDPRGRIKFSYAFNPDANDRNLEFDPKKNLFLDLEPKQRVREP